MTDIELPDEEQELEIEDSFDDSESVEQENVPQNDDDGKHEDEEEYGKKVQKRINKLVAERNVEREENRRNSERLAELEAKLNERETMQQESEISERLAEIKRRKMEFMDEGEYEKAEELNDELLDLKLKQHVKPQKQEQSYEQPQQPVELPTAQKAWIESNDWYGKNAGSAKARYANDLYIEIVNEGYDPNDEETYKELDNRLGNSSQKPSRSARPPSPSAPDRGGAVGSTQKTGITQRDIVRMRDFGLDPNDTAQRDLWIKNKRG